MKTIATCSSGPHHTAVDLGAVAALGEYVTPLAPGVEIPGKVFFDAAVNSTSTNLSFTVLPAHASSDMIHVHTENEEIYLILTGRGEFKVDGETIPVREGSVVRIAPAGRRSWRNTGDEAMTVLCIQAREGSLSTPFFRDGVILDEKEAWK